MVLFIENLWSACEQLPNMGYHKTVLFVGVICRAAVIQVLSASIVPPSTNSQEVTDNDRQTTTTSPTDMFASTDLNSTPGEETESLPWPLIGGVAGGCILLALILIIVLSCYCHRRWKRSHAEPPRPPPINTDTVHTDETGTRYKFDKRGNRVYVDDGIDLRPPIATPREYDAAEDTDLVYDNEQVPTDIRFRPMQPPLPGQHFQPSTPHMHQTNSQIDEPFRRPPPIPNKEPLPESPVVGRPPNPPPKPVKPSPAPPKPKPKPVIRPANRKNGSPVRVMNQPDFEDTYQIPDAEKETDFGGTYDDVGTDNVVFDSQESYDDVDSAAHQDQPDSDGDDYDDVPDPYQSAVPHSPPSVITQDTILREYGDDKFYQNQPVLDSKTKTSYRYRNLAMTKGEKIESEMPYLVKR